MTRPFLSFEAAIEQALGPVAGLKILDIGCGSGGKTRVLAAMGATVTGLEPRAEAVAEARAKGGATFHVGGVDDAPEGLGPFDIAIFTMSLHHTPDPAAALAFARRMTRPGGRVAVLEPEADDPSYPLLRLIDDEAEVYANAQAAINEAEALTRETTLFYAERDAVTDAEAYLADMIAVDPARAAARSHMDEIEAAFDAVVVEDTGGKHIPFWLRLDVLRVA